MNTYVQSHLKGMNRQTVFYLLKSVGQISKAEIARCTGISGPTVLKIINFFFETGLVCEADENESGGQESILGRKPHLLKLNPNANYSVAVFWEGNFIKIGIVNLAGEIIYHKKVMFEKLNIECVLNSMLQKYIIEAIEDSGIKGKKILGVGIGIPAVIDDESKLIGPAPVIGLTKQVNFLSKFNELESSLGIPIYIENDVKIATVGEYAMRRHEKITDMAYISLGAGLGAGIILDGKLWQGRNRHAGEISYMVFDPDYILKKGEPGWLENKINLQAVRKKFKLPMGNIENMIKEKKDEVIDYISPFFALSIINLAVQLDVSVIVVGGIFIDILGQELTDALIKKVNTKSYYNVNIQMQKSVDSGIIGAANMVVEANLQRLLGE